MVDTRTLASDIENLHITHKTHRPLSADYEFVGLRGREEFALITGLSLDRSMKPRGDAGFAFLEFGGICVKTARKPYNLIVETGKTDPAIYVLAKYHADETVEFLGWCGKDDLIKRPPRDFGYGVTSHWVPARELEPIQLLIDGIKDGIND